MIHFRLIQLILPFLSMMLYAALLIFFKSFRTDHFLAISLILIGAYAGKKARAFLQFAFPFLLTFIIYDSQRFYSDKIRGTIRVAEPYQFDQKFFGIQTAQGLLTPNEWCQLHTHPLLDFITGFAYLTFFTLFILIAAYFAIVLSRTGTSRRSAEWMKRRAYQMPWAFFWLNLLGYTTYYWYPAAPPWYVALYGLGPARLDVPSNPAGCLRFDALLGTHFFTSMYERSADVFGAIPSLHIAYPLLAIFYAFDAGVLRVFSVLFYLLMCFSAVYLNHHYILDILWGSAYTALIFFCMQAYERYSLKNRKA